MIDWILLAVGMLMLIKGADYFVDGASKIAKTMYIPTLIIGLTLVSMGTSAPELSVSIQAALSGKNDLSFGNVIGSNVFNTFLILGVASIFIPLVISDEMKKYDIPIMVFLYGLMLLFGFVVTPYKLDQIESIILVILFISYIVLLIVRAKKSKQEDENIEQKMSYKNIVLSIILALIGAFAILGYNTLAIILMCIFIIIMFIKINKNISKESKKLNIIISIIFVIGGLLAIIGGGTLVVNSASNIALSLGMSQTLIGLTIVAVGTSLPELVTSVVASIKKENDIAIGNVIGSNIFNILFILGVSSSISNLEISNRFSFGVSESLIDLLVLLLSGVLVFIIAKFGKNIKKWQGVIFILLYIAYIVYIIMREFA